MAKKIDVSKIERIRQAAVEIISENGISGSSVAAIAKQAQVSSGYLYRHYPSKVELVNDLLNGTLNAITDRINVLIAKHDNIQDVVSGIIDFIIESATARPHKLKFLIMLLNDFSTEIDPSIREQIRQIGETLINKGLQTHSIREDASVEDFYIALVSIPMQYLAARYQFGFTDSKQGYTEQELKKMCVISMCAIQ